MTKTEVMDVVAAVHKVLDGVPLQVSGLALTHLLAVAIAHAGGKYVEGDRSRLDAAVVTEIESALCDVKDCYASKKVN